jgi:hypothetical protein
MEKYLMKPILVKEYPYTGDYYSYTVITSADGTVTTKRYATFPVEVKLSITTNLLGQLKIDSLSKMQRESILKNVRDKNGQEIYENGEWEIIQTAPLLSAIGTKEGYQYIAIIKSGDI